MVLLTGATGYLGSQIAQELMRRRESFRVLVSDPSRLLFDATAASCDVVTGDGYRITSLETGLPGAFAAMTGHVKSTERAKP